MLYICNDDTDFQDHPTKKMENNRIGKDIN